MNSKTRFIAIIGGRFDKNGGRPSGLISKLIDAVQTKWDKQSIKDPNGWLPVAIENGGNYNDLGKVQEDLLAIKPDAVLWAADVPNDMPKIRDIKAILPHTMLIMTKNNTTDKYDIEDIIQRALAQKANLLLEFRPKDDCGHYPMRLLDPLGCEWSCTSDITATVDAMLDRLTFLSDMTRQSTIQDLDEVGVCLPDQPDFFETVRTMAPRFAFAMAGEDAHRIDRFLGNASFRCVRGFPSMRSSQDGWIFVSRRNVPKDHITREDFVPVKFDSQLNQIIYNGCNKPSVDTPVQVRLYNALPRINYMIHGHVYLRNAYTTDNAVPCGALQEVEEVLSLLRYRYGSLDLSDYRINLKGHGCLIMTNEPPVLTQVELQGRPMPEIMHS